ncbi:MAG TPA: glycine cleavage T C-terminal barrel domain-containing protein [Motilibacteraceae bacterium]|nr:glycine cleavage T C-terminal barrel domain-containing protein [Motilibacteraceae bacterium]
MTAPTPGHDATDAPAYRSPLLDRPGAVPADPPDAGVAAHYGDPLREQRLLEQGEAVVDLSHRGVVRVTGPDRLSWLHSLTSQHLTGLPAGESTQALVLDPHGHVEHHLSLVDDGTSVWAHVEPGTAPALVAYLESMKFWTQVEVADVTADHAVVHEPVREPHPEHVAVVDAVGRAVLVPRAELVAYAGDRPLAGTWALEALRIVAHQPRFGLETDHRTIPHELGWIGPAVHLDKGCYRGQETVARVHNLGRPPRRLVLLHLDGSVDVLPPHGAPVELDGRAVGTVTSSARHHELGPVALAVVKRSTPTDAALLAGGVAAAQEVVVPA